MSLSRANFQNPGITQRSARNPGRQQRIWLPCFGAHDPAMPLYRQARAHGTHVLLVFQLLMCDAIVVVQNELD